MSETPGLELEVDLEGRNDTNTVVLSLDSHNRFRGVRPPVALTR